MYETDERADGRTDRQDAQRVCHCLMFDVT